VPRWKLTASAGSLKPLANALWPTLISSRSITDPRIDADAPIAALAPPAATRHRTAECGQQFPQSDGDAATSALIPPHVHRKRDKLIVVGRCLGAEAGWPTGFERLWPAWWNYSVQVSHKRCGHAHSHNRGRATQPAIKVDVRAHPPKQHSAANTEPERSPHKISKAQMGNRFEPRDYCEAKGEPKEQHYGNEKRCYETHCFTDTSCCTSDTLRTFRSTWSRPRPRPRPRATSTAPRHRLEASLSSHRPEPKPRYCGLRNIEGPRYVSLHRAISKALESFLPLLRC